MSEIVSYRGVSLQTPEILEAVIKQLNKDIAMSGMHETFDEKQNVESLIENFTEWAVLKLEKDDSQLLNFLYRVDVKQSSIYSNDKSPHTNFVKLVLERELQKIVLRQQFSSPGDTKQLE